jgi:hypothetical protein
MRAVFEALTGHGSAAEVAGTRAAETAAHAAHVTSAKAAPADVSAPSAAPTRLRIAQSQAAGEQRGYQNHRHPLEHWTSPLWLRPLAAGFASICERSERRAQRSGRLMQKWCAVSGGLGRSCCGRLVFAAMSITRRPADRSGRRSNCKTDRLRTPLSTKLAKQPQTGARRALGQRKQNVLSSAN